MIDREKVIRGLEVCSTVQDLAPCPNECPYHKPDAVCYGTARLMQDALALLREQESVRPKREYAGHRIIMLCGACGAPIPTPGGWRYKYCPTCGRGIKWDAD